MRLALPLASLLLTTPTAFTPASTVGTNQLAAQGLAKLKEFELSQSSSSSCTSSTAYVRREWSAFSDAEKREYINAVLCLQAKESISGSIAPGARSRYDDFVATHINQTVTIHGTGNFLTWHRYFIWTYEQTLRNECNYIGYQPYLNWGRYAEDPLHAPVFDGSETSLSGNGAYQNHTGYGVPTDTAAYFVVPPGVGGGCVTSGPFANMTVALGPLAPAATDVPANPQSDGLGYNPRCLRRDISTWCGQTALTDQNTTDLITGRDDIYSFQTAMQGDFPNGLIGVHTAGHYLVGSDPGGDLFASPGDPYFYLHHAQIDRIYWIWQMQDMVDRQDALAGNVLFGDATSANTTLDDTLQLGVNDLMGEFTGITIREAMSTLAGPFCYIYE